MLIIPWEMPAWIDCSQRGCPGAGLLSLWVSCGSFPWSMAPRSRYSPWGIVHQDKQLCLARAQRRGEVRDLRCKYVREKPGGWGMWRGGLYWGSFVQRVTLISLVFWDYHFGLQEIKGPISPSLLFLQGLAVVSEPKDSMICFVTGQANAGHHLGMWWKWFSLSILWENSWSVSKTLCFLPSEFMCFHLPNLCRHRNPPDQPQFSKLLRENPCFPLALEKFAGTIRCPWYLLWASCTLCALPSVPQEKSLCATATPQCGCQTAPAKSVLTRAPKENSTHL